MTMYIITDRVNKDNPNPEKDNKIINGYINSREMILPSVKVYSIWMSEYFAQNEMDRLNKEAGADIYNVQPFPVSDLKYS